MERDFNEYKQVTGVLAKAGERLNEEAERLEGWLQDVRDHRDPIKDIAVAMFTIKGLYETLDAAVKRFYHVANSLDKGILPERFSDDGLDMIRVPEIGRSFSIRQSTSASMVDKAGAIEWLRENGLGDIVQETVNAGTLAATCKSMLLENGLEPPPELIKVSTYSSVSVTKYTPKAK